MTDFIPYGRQDISQADIDAVVDVLRSDFLTQGPAVPAFEASIADYCGSTHGVAVNSATSALHIACLALGVGSGDIVWTSPVTFVASANCALYCGAEVDFVDIDSDTFNMCTSALEEKLRLANAERRLPKVVIPVHLCGQPCDMARIAELGEAYGFSIIEDASHAIGGKYQGQAIGNCAYSDITVFSFHPVKIITTAEGGLAVTNQLHLAQQMQLLRSHGVTRDPALLENEPHGGWYYEQVALGFNYRMTDLQAALGLSQMKRLDEFVQRRHEIASRYEELLADLPVKTATQLPDSYSGMHLFVIRLHLQDIQLSHNAVFESLRSAGVGVNLHYMPVYLQPYYKRLGFQPGHCPNAEAYYEEAISLPMFPLLTDAQQEDVVQRLAACITPS